MAITRKSLTQLASEAESDIASGINGVSAGLRYSILRAIARGIANVADSLYAYAGDRAKAATPATSMGKDLDRWASVWSIQRGSLSPATGTVTISGAIGEVVIAGTTLTSATSLQYSTIETVAIGSGGTASVAVQCLTSGVAGNLSTSAELTILSAPFTISATAIVEYPGLTGGADEQSDDELFQAIVDRVSTPPQGGSKADYERWAKQVPGISRSWCQPAYAGPGTVRVFVASDDATGPETASAEQVAAVAAYIETLRPAGAVVVSGGSVVSGVTIQALTEQATDLTLQLSPDTSARRAEITDEIAAYFRDRATPEGTLTLKGIRNAGESVPGKFTLDVITPTVDPTASALSILTLGNITWA